MPSARFFSLSRNFGTFLIFYLVIYLCPWFEIVMYFHLILRVGKSNIQIFADHSQYMSIINMHQYHIKDHTYAL